MTRAGINICLLLYTQFYHYIVPSSARVTKPIFRIVSALIIRAKSRLSTERMQQKWVIQRLLILWNPHQRTVSPARGDRTLCPTHLLYGQIPACQAHSTKLASILNKKTVDSSQSFFVILNKIPLTIPLGMLQCYGFCSEFSRVY